MKTIRWKFVSVFAATTAATMVAVLVLFNIALRFYFEKNARDELKHTFSTMNVLIEKQLMLSVVSDASREALLDLSAALTASRLSGNTSFFIFDEDFRLRFPESGAESDLSDQLMEKIKSYDYASGRIEKVRTGKGAFFIAGVPFDKLNSGRLYIVFISGTAKMNRMIGTMNLMLAAVMLASLGAGLFCAVASARSLTRPILDVCRYAREIGNGHFITVPPDTSTVETSELTSSINEMSERLRAADQAQKLFLQNASHELRTPLMSIQGYSEAIEKGIGIDPREAARIIKAESIRLTTLVEELITLSKYDSNIYNREFVDLDLGEAVADSIERISGLALKEGKKITAELEPKVVVRGDDGLLANVLDNVLSNSLRYAEKEVRIVLSSVSGAAVIRVSDDGAGFDAEDLKHLFERFYKGKGGKFGLGLSIAQKAAELLGGSIEARNGDRGAEFVIRLPLVHQET